MRTIIRGGQLLTPDETLDGLAVVIDDGRISALAGESLPAADRVIDAHGLKVIPGLIDVHVHGADGHDTMDASSSALAEMAAFFVRHGVTSFLATTITAPSQAIGAAIDNVRSFLPRADAARPLGVHLEGPYLSHKYCGAQPVQSLRAPDPDEYRQWFDSGVVRLITVAPELAGASELIRVATEQGIRVSVGHTDASYADVRRATDAGLSHATHLFNGMPGLHHRSPGPVGAVLTDDRVYAELILDGIHLHPSMADLVVRAKGIHRTMLVTDAMRATGLGDGAYDLGGQMVDVRAGVARTASGGLAGSTLRLNSAIRNAIQFAHLTPNAALAMATRVPAEAMGWANCKGSLRVGADADIVLVDDDWNVHAALIGGELAFDTR